MAKYEQYNIIGAAGTFLVVDGVLSLALSDWKTPLATFSRLVRVAIGAGMVIHKW